MGAITFTGYIDGLGDAVEQGVVIWHTGTCPHFQSCGLLACELFLFLFGFACCHVLGT